MAHCMKLIAGLFVCSFATSVYAEGGTFENIHCYSGQPQNAQAFRH